MKTTTISATAFAALLLVAGACQNRQTATNASASPQANTPAPAASAAPGAASPEQLGALGAAIKRSPNDAHKLIQQQGLTEESFAAAVRKVSEDPAAAKRYAAAFKQAS